MEFSPLGPTQHLFVGYRELFLSSKATGTLTTHFNIVLRLRMSGAMSLLLHMPSWKHRQLYLYLSIPRVTLCRTKRIFKYAFKLLASGHCYRVEL
jgi:hypothetical protein